MDYPTFQYVKGKAMTHFDVYGRMAAAGVDEVHQNGRYPAQKDGEKYVPADIISKLSIAPQDRFLDIGCGMGLNLFPVAAIAGEADCCDHHNVIKKLQEKKLPENVTCFSGDFLNIDFKKTYTKILAYSVLPALPNDETLYAFVDKALTMLSPEGKMLFGDMANIDKKKRFLASKRGAAFQEEWNRLCSQMNDGIDVSIFRTENDNAVIIDDAYMMKLVLYIRSKGYNSYLLDQPANLPFGNTREDILITGPEYRNET